MVSFQFVNLFPSVPVKRTLENVKVLLKRDVTLSDRSGLSVQAILTLFEDCVSSVYIFDTRMFYMSSERGYQWQSL